MKVKKCAVTFFHSTNVKMSLLSNGYQRNECVLKYFSEFRIVFEKTRPADNGYRWKLLLSQIMWSCNVSLPLNLEIPQSAVV